MLGLDTPAGSSESLLLLFFLPPSPLPSPPLLSSLFPPSPLSLLLLFLPPSPLPSPPSLFSSLPLFLPPLSPSLSFPLSPSLSLLLPPSPLSPASQFLSVIQPGQTSAQKEALLGVSPRQDRHTVGQPRANGGEHWVYADRDESGGGSEARERVSRANAQGLVKNFPHMHYKMMFWLARPSPVPVFDCFSVNICVHWDNNVIFYSSAHCYESQH